MKMRKDKKKVEIEQSKAASRYGTVEHIIVAAACAETMIVDIFYGDLVFLCNVVHPHGHCNVLQWQHFQLQSI